MRYILLLCVLGLALTLDLSVLVATSGNRLESFDPRHPATLLPIVADRLRTVSAAAGELARDLVEWFAAPYRERLQRPLPTEPAPH